MTTPISVTVATHNGVPVAEVRGELDLSNVAQVRTAIASVVTNTARALIVDLSDTTYMDSRGVHLLFEIAERLAQTQQQLVVVVPPLSPIRRLLAITHLDHAAPIEATVADAFARLGGAPGPAPVP
ncbi:MAG TPA: STAS domain-containing protein [bacterium]|nr:STAS domain-containing protein [bacterium]